MVIDNCPAHPNVQAQLQAIKLVFLPPNTTSMLQPCDQGIIRNLKVHYRHILLQNMVVAIDNNELFSINVLDALRILHTAWDKVTKQTIANYFHHAGFTDSNRISADTTCPSSNSESMAMECTDEAVTSSLLVGMGFTDFVSVDNDVVTTEVMSDDDIIESLSYNPNPELEEEEDDSNPLPPPPTATNARIALAVIRHFFEAQQDSHQRSWND